MARRKAEPDVYQPIIDLVSRRLHNRGYRFEDNKAIETIIFMVLEELNFTSQNCYAHLMGMAQRDNVEGAKLCNINRVNHTIIEAMKSPTYGPAMAKLKQEAKDAKNEKT